VPERDGEPLLNDAGARHEVAGQEVSFRAMQNGRATDKAVSPCVRPGSGDASARVNIQS